MDAVPGSSHLNSFQTLVLNKNHHRGDIASVGYKPTSGGATAVAEYLLNFITMGFYFAAMTSKEVDQVKEDFAHIYNALDNLRQGASTQVTLSDGKTYTFEDGEHETVKITDSNGNASTLPCKNLKDLKAEMENHFRANFDYYIDDLNENSSTDLQCAVAKAIKNILADSVVDGQPVRNISEDKIRIGNAMLQNVPLRNSIAATLEIIPGDLSKQLKTASTLPVLNQFLVRFHLDTAFRDYQSLSKEELTKSLQNKIAAHKNDIGMLSVFLEYKNLIPLMRKVIDDGYGQITKNHREMVSSNIENHLTDYLDNYKELPPAIRTLVDELVLGKVKPQENIQKKQAMYDIMDRYPKIFDRAVVAKLRAKDAQNPNPNPTTVAPKEVADQETEEI